MSYFQIVSFLCGTLFILWFSWWASIKEKRYHGIFRFFSFESILYLALTHARYWFEDPFCLAQICSWILLVLSIYLAIPGFVQLIKRGKPSGRFENTSILITSGMFRFIRHPLYCSLLLLGTGIWLKNPLPLDSIVAFLVNTIAIYLTAREEEREMTKRFGTEYLAYMKRSKMFIPYVF